MTYVFPLKRYRRSIGMLLILLVTGSLHAGEPTTVQPKLTVIYPATELLLGEPLELTVRVTWEEPTASTVVYANGLLAVEVETDTGKLPFTGGPEDFTSLEGKIGRRLDFSLTSENPVWEKSIPLNYRYRISQPGTHHITVHWIPAPLNAQVIALIRSDVEEEHPDKELMLLESYRGSAAQDVYFGCPEREEDRAAYEFLAGGACPEKFLSEWMLFRPEPRFEELYERFPTCRYVGYALHRIFKSPYILGYDWTKQDGLVLALANGRFIREHPTLKSPRAGIRDTKTIVTMRLEAYSGFLDANPGFQQRDQFEIAIGLDLLALGRTEDAAQRWQWVVDHDHAGSSLDSAREYLAGLKRQGLLDDENE